MDITIKTGDNSVIKNSYKVISSKSVMHRSLICAAFSDLPTKIVCNGYGEDVLCTIEALRTLGADIEATEYGFFVRPLIREFIPIEPENVADGEEIDDTRGIHKLAAVPEGTKVVIDCGASASTYRFMDEICKELGIEYELTGTPRLLERVHSTKFTSQTMSGMIMALGLRPGLEELEVECPSFMPSQPYVGLTMKVIDDFGCSGYESPGKYEVEGDWSQAAYYMAIGATNCEERIGKLLIGGKPVRITGLDTESVQGDREFVEILRKFGAVILTSGNAVSIKPSKLTATNIDMLQTPDLMPITAIVAAQATGDSVLRNVGHLKYKESDRVAATISMVNALGGHASLGRDGNSIIIHGLGDKLSGGIVESHNDHRIAMAGAAASFGSYGEVIIKNAECVAKSCPGFWKELGI